MKQLNGMFSSWDYQGEIDSNGDACGFGLGMNKTNPGEILRGTFLENQA